MILLCNPCCIIFPHSLDSLGLTHLAARCQHLLRTTREIHFLFLHYHIRWFPLEHLVSLQISVVARQKKVTLIERNDTIMWPKKNERFPMFRTDKNNFWLSRFFDLCVPTFSSKKFKFFERKVSGYLPPANEVAGRCFYTCLSVNSGGGVTSQHASSQVTWSTSGGGLPRGGSASGGSASKGVCIGGQTPPPQN